MFTDLLSRRAPGQALLVSRLAVEGAATEAEQLSPVCAAGDRGAAVLPWQLALGSWLRISSHPASQGGPLGKAVICSLCVRACIVTQSCGLQPARLLCPWGSPGKNTGASCHLLLQGIFPTQGLTPSLPGLLHWHWPAVLYHCASWEAPIPRLPVANVTLGSVRRWTWPVPEKPL